MSLVGHNSPNEGACQKIIGGGGGSHPTLPPPPAGAIPDCEAQTKRMTPC